MGATVLNLLTSLWRGSFGRLASWELRLLDWLIARLALRRFRLAGRPVVTLSPRRDIRLIRRRYRRPRGLRQ